MKLVFLIDLPKIKQDGTAHQAEKKISEAWRYQQSITMS